MTLEERVNTRYESLTANDREMLDRIFRERKNAGNMNSTQLASFLHVSRTTLVRLMKKLDLDSYAEFKLLLNRREEDGTGQIYDLGDIVEEYHGMIDQLKNHDYQKICEVISGADTIYLYGTGNEQKAIAEEFKRIFLTFGKCCVDLVDLGEVISARERFREKDLFVAVSLSGENEEAVRVVRAARETGIRTMALTRWANNTLSRICQENLYVGTKTVGQTWGQSYEMVAAFYILLDILLVRCLEYRDRGKKGRDHED